MKRRGPGGSTSVRYLSWPDENLAEPPVRASSENRLTQILFRVKDTCIHHQQATAMNHLQTVIPRRAPNIIRFDAHARTHTYATSSTTGTHAAGERPLLPPRGTKRAVRLTRRNFTGPDPVQIQGTAAYDAIWCDS